MQVYKASWCAFHARGKCTRGTNCSFAHSHSELRKLPDLRKTKICNGFIAGTCQKSDCAYAHGFQELRDFPGKKGLCRLFREGRCIHGTRCKYAHALNELQVGYVFDNDLLQHPNVPNTLSEQSTIDSKNPYNMSSSVHQAVYHNSPNLFFAAQKENNSPQNNSSLLFPSRSVCSPKSMKDRINHSFFSMNTDPEALLKSLTSPIGSDISNISMRHVFEPKNNLYFQTDNCYYDNNSKLYNDTQNRKHFEASHMFDKDSLYEKKTNMFEKNAMYEKQLVYDGNSLLNNQTKGLDQPSEYKKNKGTFSNIPGLASLAVMQKQNEKKESLSEIWYSELSQSLNSKLWNTAALEYNLQEEYHRKELSNAALRLSPDHIYENNTNYKMQNAMQGSFWLPQSSEENAVKPSFFEHKTYKPTMPPPGLFPQHIPNVLDLLPSFLSSETCEELDFSSSPHSFETHNPSNFSNCVQHTNNLISDMATLNINKTLEHSSTMPTSMNSIAKSSNIALSNSNLLESFGLSPRAMHCKEETHMDSGDSPKTNLEVYKGLDKDCDEIMNKVCGTSKIENDEVYTNSKYLDQIKGEETTDIASCQYSDISTNAKDEKHCSNNKT